MTAKDLSPPGPEPPPPNDPARREEATSHEPIAHSKKPDFPPQVEPETPAGVEGKPANASDPSSLPTPEAEGQSQTQSTPSVEEAAQLIAAVASVFPGMFEATPFELVSEAPTPEVVPALEVGPAVPISPSTIGLEADSPGPAIADESVSAPVPKVGAEQAADVPALVAVGVTAESQATGQERGSDLASGSLQATGLSKGSETVQRPVALRDSTVESLNPTRISVPTEASGPETVNAGASLPSERAAVARPLEKNDGRMDAAEADPPGSAPLKAATAPSGDAAGSQSQSQDLAGGHDELLGSGSPQLATEIKADSMIAQGPVRASATDAPKGVEEPSAIGRAETKQVISQVADRIEMLAAARPKNGVSIRLEPEHLGTITIKVTGSLKQIEAELNASDESVRAALQSSRHELAGALQARGIHIQAMHVGSDATSATTDQQAGFAHHGQQPSKTHHGFRQEAPTSAFTLETARQFARGASGVDVWI